MREDGGRAMRRWGKSRVCLDLLVHPRANAFVAANHLWDVNEIRAEWINVCYGVMAIEQMGKSDVRSHKQAQPWPTSGRDLRKAPSLPPPGQCVEGEGRQQSVSEACSWASRGRQR
jgi:hypothetical protein